MKIIDVIAAILLVLGGLNWGLALFDFNAVTHFLGEYPNAVKTIYGLIGLSAIWQAFQWRGIQHRWHCDRAP